MPQPSPCAPVQSALPFQTRMFLGPDCQLGSATPCCANRDTILAPPQPIDSYSCIEYFVLLKRSSRNLPRQHRSAVYGQGRGESWTGEVPDDVMNACIASSLPNCTTPIGGMKLPIDGWSGCNLGQQFSFSRIERFLRHWRGNLTGHFTGRLAPTAHEAKQKSRRHHYVSPQLGPVAVLFRSGAHVE